MAGGGGLPAGAGGVVAAAESSLALTPGPTRLTAWRLVKSKFAAGAMSGEGAATFGGRWNGVGTKVVYASQSASLAMLEILVHLGDAAELRQYIMIPLTFSADLVRQFPGEQLPKGWDAPTPVPATQQLGDGFVAARESAILAVPSVVMPQEFNFVINPAHPDFSRITIGPTLKVPFDSRLRGMK
jgi:RES domain-containing protein